MSISLIPRTSFTATANPHTSVAGLRNSFTTLNRIWKDDDGSKRLGIGTGLLIGGGAAYKTGHFKDIMNYNAVENFIESYRSGPYRRYLPPDIVDKAAKDLQGTLGPILIRARKNGHAALASYYDPEKVEGRFAGNTFWLFHENPDVSLRERLAALRNGDMRPYMTHVIARPKDMRTLDGGIAFAEVLGRAGSRPATGYKIVRPITPASVHNGLPGLLVSAQETALRPGVAITTFLHDRSCLDLNPPDNYGLLRPLRQVALRIDGLTAVKKYYRTIRNEILEGRSAARKLLAECASMEGGMKNIAARFCPGKNWKIAGIAAIGAGLFLAASFIHNRLQASS